MVTVSNSSLIWVGGLISIGIAAGMVAFAFIPARYSSAVTMHIQAREVAPDERFASRFDAQLAQVLRAALAEDRIATVMEESNLYAAERKSDRFADALLSFRRNTDVSRFRESGSAERWVVTFEADDPITSERVSRRLAELIKEEGDNAGLTDVRAAPSLRLLEDLFHELRASRAELEAWPLGHADGLALGLVTLPILLRRRKTK